MMNDRPTFLVNLLTYLLTYFNTERTLLGSRRRFDGVNMGFSD